MSAILDERLGLPSASSALADSLCPGRFRAQAEWDSVSDSPIEVEEPELPEDDDDEAAHVAEQDDIDRDREAGKRIHLLYAGKPCPEASDAERDRALAGREVDQNMYRKWCEILAKEGESPVIEIREHRWWLNHDDGKPRYSGQTDAVWIKGHTGGPCHILVGDLKALWGYHDRAALNLQIRRYISLISVTIETMGFTKVLSAMGYLNQPAKTMNPEPVMFDEDALSLASFEMMIDLARMEDPDAARVPGPVQCHHCRAKLLCEEYQASTGALTATPLGTTPLPSKAEMADRIAKLDGARLATLLPWADSLKDMLHLAKVEAKRRLRQDPNSVPGYELKKNSPRSWISNVQKVFEKLSTELGVTGQEFTAMCETTKKAVTTTVRAKSGLKGKALEARVKEVLEGATSPTPVSDSLVQKE